MPETPKDSNADSNESDIVISIEKLKEMNADGSLAQLGITAEFNPEDPQSIAEIRRQIEEKVQAELKKEPAPWPGLMTSLGKDHTARNMMIGLGLFGSGIAAIDVKQNYEEDKKIKQEILNDDSIDVSTETGYIYSYVSEWKAKHPEITHIQLVSMRALKGKNNNPGVSVGMGGKFVFGMSINDGSFDANEITLLIGRKSDSPVMIRLKELAGKVISDEDEQEMRGQGAVTIEEDWHEIGLGDDVLNSTIKRSLLTQALDVYDEKYPSETSS